MFPVKGYFKSLDCPCFEIGLCDRLYCLFRHYQKNTECINLEREIQRSTEAIVFTEEKLTHKTHDSSIKNKEYNPTPILELNNRQVWDGFPEEQFDQTKDKSVFDALSNKSFSSNDEDKNFSEKENHNCVGSESQMEILKQVSNDSLSDDSIIEIIDSETENNTVDDVKANFGTGTSIKNRYVQNISQNNCVPKRKEKLKPPAKDKNSSLLQSKNNKHKDETYLVSQPKRTVNKFKQRDDKTSKTQMKDSFKEISSSVKSDSFYSSSSHNCFASDKIKDSCKISQSANDNRISVEISQSTIQNKNTLGVCRPPSKQIDLTGHFKLKSESLKLDYRVENNRRKRIAMGEALLKKHKRIRRKVEMMTPAKRFLMMANIRNKKVNHVKSQLNEVNIVNSQLNEVNKSQVNNDKPQHKLNLVKPKRSVQAVKIRSVPNVKSLLKEKEELLKKIENYKKCKSTK
ncbi:uncharacterized protein LOC128995601 [Macrosteles quadrilineatus]|uniref:uncharacterized protein LOC128995601 n=1 Tax=Macrosteles quadrilineatus TaxID=74068 RepID=UPI0023E0964D|nr:uncharacterized protein LOC128995601 [Macrosteles quadrilineatus]